MVTIAKGVASGMPTGMCAARAQVADAFEPGDHGSTFGGSCLAVAAAEATLRTLADEGFAARVERHGRVLARTPGRRCQGWWKCEGSVSWWRPIWRRKRPPRPTWWPAAWTPGVLPNATGPHTLRFLPPLVCARRHVDALVEKLVGLL